MGKETESLKAERHAYQLTPYTLNDLGADTYTAFVRTPGPSGTHTMSNTVTFTITS